MTLSRVLVRFEALGVHGRCRIAWESGLIYPWAVGGSVQIPKMHDHGVHESLQNNY